MNVEEIITNLQKDVKIEPSEGFAFTTDFLVGNVMHTSAESIRRFAQKNGVTSENVWCNNQFIKAYNVEEMVRAYEKKING